VVFSLNKYLVFSGAFLCGSALAELHQPPGSLNPAYDPPLVEDWPLPIDLFGGLRQEYYSFPLRSETENSVKDYALLIQNLPARLREEREKRLKADILPLPNPYGALPVVDFMISQASSDPVSEISKHLLNSPRSFSAIHSMNKYNVWVRPVAAFNRFESSNQASFGIKSYGGLIGASVNFDHRFLVGLAGGYTYSKVRWSEASDQVDSVTFQPYTTYLLPHGYVYFTSKLTANRHNVERRHKYLSNQSVALDATMRSLNISLRAKGGYDIPWSAIEERHLYLRPNACAEWDLILNGQLQEEGGYLIDKSFSSLLQTTVGLQMRGEFLASLGAFVPTLDLGWNCVLPKGKKAFEVQNQQLGKTLPSSSQLMLGIGVSFFHTRAILIGASFQTHLFGHYRRKKVELSIEFDW
jgi:outer membrane autotransporter protein